MSAQSREAAANAVHTLVDQVVSLQDTALEQERDRATKWQAWRDAQDAVDNTNAEIKRLRDEIAKRLGPTS